MSQDTLDDGGDRNTVSESNRNVMDSPEAGRDVNQHNETHQHYHDSGPTVIPNPNPTNGWINFCEWIAGLPVSETKLVGALVGTGGIGFLAVIVAVSPIIGPLIDQSLYTSMIGLAFVSALSLAIGVAYVRTDEDSQCPECDERFALRETETRKTDVTEQDGKPNTVHGEQDFECRNCNYETTVTTTWPASELS